MLPRRRLSAENWKLWKELRQEFWSDDAALQRNALAKVSDLQLVGDVPVELEVTAALFRAKLASETPDPDTETLQTLCAIPLIRLTAAMRDQAEKLSMRPGSELPHAVGLARNRYVHGARPTLEHLTSVSAKAMDFIKANYWDFIGESLYTDQSVQEGTQSFLEALEHLAESSLASESGISLTEGLLEALQDALSKIQAGFSGHELHKALLDCSFETDREKLMPLLQTNLLAFCESYGPLWLVYFAETWIERTLLCLHAPSEEIASVSWLSLSDWGAVIASALPLKTVSLDAKEVERMVQKLMELAQSQPTGVPPEGRIGAAATSVVRSTDEIFRWLMGQVHDKRAEKRLTGLFEALCRRRRQKSSTVRSPDPGPGEESVGRFTRLRDWQSCAIGELPYTWPSE